MSIELRNPKGTADYMPKEQKVRQDIVRKLQDVFERYGYQPLETPIISCFDVLASKYAGGAEILKEVYRLNDRGGRELGLRYDLTVPFSRVVGMNPEMRMPFKRYEIGKVFRDGPVKTGRSREFVQCDVDMVGVGSVMAEADLLAMAAEVYGMLGLSIYITYNNRKLLSGLMTRAGISPESVSAAILSIDKLEKTGYGAVKEELLEKGIEAASIDMLFYFMNMKAEELNAEFGGNSCGGLIAEGLRELGELDEFIDAAGIRNVMRFSPSLARGLEIYTGTVWEVFLSDGGITSSLGAGGRYDGIIGAFLGSGLEYPAVGMTFGLDVIYEALCLKGSFSSVSPADLYIIPLGTEKEAMAVAAGLRRQGLRTDIEMSGRKLKKALDYVNKQGIPYAVIIGDNEVRERRVRIKDMERGTEVEAGFDEMPAVIKNIMEAGV